MMQRRTLLLALMLTSALALPAEADVTSEIVAGLERRGYQAVTVSRTLLGRVRITAVRDGETREIILNPATGEILRDLTRGRSGAGGGDDIVDREDKDNSGKGGGDDDGGDDGDSGGGGDGGDGGGDSGGGGGDDGDDN